jgi:hypothetical protein
VAGGVNIVNPLAKKKQKQRQIFMALLPVVLASKHLPCKKIKSNFEYKYT